MDEIFIDVDGRDPVDPFDPKPAPSRRRKMNIFYLIDTSGSMSGERIESVNQVMPEVIDIVSKISEENKDNAEICVSALLFSNGTKWLYSEPLPSDQFVWQDQQARGGTDMGEACIELEQALHREGPKAQLKSTSGYKNPAIILLSDGEPTDNFERGLEKLKANRWFKDASKIAFGIGMEHGLENLAKFTGSRELVIKVTDVDALKEMIKVASAVVSSVGSRSASAKSNGEQSTPQEEIVAVIKKEAEDQSDVTIGTDVLPPSDMYD